jgi:hypothetical protein
MIHPVVGELTLHFQRFDITESALTMFTYTAEPGTRSAQGLSLLTSWAATTHDTPSDRSPLENLEED